MKSPADLWKKLENSYITKSLSNKFYLKKQVYIKRMGENDSLHDHLNKFNRAVTDLLSVEVEIDEEDKTLLIIGSLNKSYDNLGKTLLYSKDSIDYDDVVVALLLDDLMTKDTKECKERNSNLSIETNGHRGRRMNKGNESRERSKLKGKGKLPVSIAKVKVISRKTVLR